MIGLEKVNRPKNVLWGNVMLVAALIMFSTSIAAPYLIVRPQDLHICGLWAWRLFRISAVVFSLCAILLYFYTDYLYKLLSSEEGIFRLRRYYNLYDRLLYVIGVMAIVQLFATVINLSTIQHITYAHVFHSRIFIGLGYLFLGICLFLIPRKYIRIIRTIHPSVFLDKKREFLMRTKTEKA